jgi:Tfp pilus assembly protein PilN
MSILTDHTAEVAPPEAGFDMFASREYIPPRANLLPPEIAERLALRRVIAGMVAAAVLCGGAVAGLYVSAESGKAPAQAELADAQTQHAALAAQQAKLAPAQAAHQQVLAANKSLAAAMGSEVLWSDQLNTLRGQLTAGVRLSSLAVSEAAGAGAAAASAVTLPAAPAGSTATSAATPATTPAATATAAAAAPIASVTMAGLAVSNYALADWLDALAKLHGWSSIYLTGTSTDAAHQGLVTFTITANITDAALSHRYTNGS